jgi:hypothetical protein
VHASTVRVQCNGKGVQQTAEAVQRTTASQLQHRNGLQPEEESGRLQLDICFSPKSGGGEESAANASEQTPLRIIVPRNRKIESGP